MKIIKKIKDTPAGIRLQVIGYIVFATCWIIPLVLIDVLSIESKSGLIIMLVQMGIGGFLIILGNIVERRVDYDPDFTVSDNIFRIFRAWQILLMIAVVLLVAKVFSNLYEVNIWISRILSCSMLGCFIAAAVVGAIQHKKKKKNYISVGNGKMINANSPVKYSLRCNKCRKPLNSDDYQTFEGKRLCSSCYMITLAANQENNEERNVRDLQTKCHICGKSFPKSSLHVVNKSFMCEECFQRKYGPNDF